MNQNQNEHLVSTRTFSGRILPRNFFWMKVPELEQAAVIHQNQNKQLFSTRISSGGTNQNIYFLEEYYRKIFSGKILHPFFFWMRGLWKKNIFLFVSGRIHLRPKKSFSGRIPLDKNCQSHFFLVKSNIKKNSKFWPKTSPTIPKILVKSIIMIFSGRMSLEEYFWKKTIIQ